MPIMDWPQLERPREKLLHRGSESLSDAELLAIFFRTGTVGKTAVDMAREALSEFGSLRRLVAAPKAEFCSLQGIGAVKYVQIQAALELGKRCLREALDRKDVMSSPDDTRQYILARLRPYEHEVFACLFLDNQHRVISFDEMFTGTIDGASVHSREVVKAALQHNAAAVIFAHNHPSGVAEPSQADRRITEKLVASLLLVDIRVLDHVVVGDLETISFAERGYL